ncbi:hypothetical protein [Azospirillum sp. B4]|uniref:hypothetical protein n=1 Tax=Azospirillum sp. B4 TaxID=95605 RepID=UPI00034AF087|nr:hypothetical protein [Azospirillum sp. B4]
MPTWPPLDRAAPLDRTALVLAAAGLAVGAGIALAVALDASDRPVRVLAPLPAVPPLAGPTPMGLSAEPGEAMRRPLFTPDRRPPTTTGGAGASDGPDVQVTGVVTGPGGGAATGLDRKAQKPFSVRLGDDVQGWTVESIGRIGIRLRRGAAVRDYPLSLPPPPTAGAPVIPPASTAPPPSPGPLPGEVPSGKVPNPLAPATKPPAAAQPPTPSPNPQPPPDPQQLDTQPNHPPSRPPRQLP